MSDEKQREIANGIVSKYGFHTGTNIISMNMDLLNSKCWVNLYVYNDSVCARFNGDFVKRQTEQCYNLNIKNDINKFKTRTRNIAKMALAYEKEQALTNDSSFKEYKKVAEALVERKLAFATSIKKDSSTSAAIIKVNGHKIKFFNTNGTVGINLGNTRAQIPGELALQIAAMLPGVESEDFN